jgi:hypothetical protein
MRIISLDLLLGTPRLKRRIEVELAQLTRDVADVRGNAHQLREAALSLEKSAVRNAGTMVRTK